MLEGIIGPMFAGKTSTLLQRVEHAEIAGETVAVFTHAQDTRYTDGEATTHTGASITATPVANHDLTPIQSCDAAVIGIDEIQFFSGDIIPVIEQLQAENRHVIYAGLATDFRGEPFSDTMKELLPRTDDITVKTAVCTAENNGEICGAPATQTQRLVDGEPVPYTDDQVRVGDDDLYEARCRRHHVVPNHPRR